MIKKNLNDARYIYTLLRFIELIKLYIESKLQHIRTAEYSHKIVLLRLIMLLILIEIKATIEFCITELDFVQNFGLNWQFWFFSQSFIKKGISRHKQTNKQTKMKTTIEFCITELNFVQNFSLNWQFFRQSFPKKGISSLQQIKWTLRLNSACSN